MKIKMPIKREARLIIKRKAKGALAVGNPLRHAPTTPEIAADAPVAGTQELGRIARSKVFATTCDAM